MASILNFGCRCGVIWLLFFLTGHTPMFDGCEVPRTNTINTLGRKRSIGLRLQILLTTPHSKSYTKATSHMRLRARDQYISSTLIGGNGGAGPSSCFTLHLRDQWSMWMHDGCEVYTDSYMASNGLCFVVTWTIFKNHLLNLGLTQNHWETMALRTLTTVDLFYFVMRKDTHELKFTEIAFGWGPRYIWLSHYTWGSITTLHGFGGALGPPLDTFFWALPISWSWLMALGSCAKWP